MEMDRLFYDGKKILITGGAGAIGSRLVRKLLRFDCRVIIIDNLKSGFLWNLPKSDHITFIKGDITKDIDLKRCFYEKPDIIFHLAAFFANQNSVDFPEKDLLVNGLGTLKLLEYTELYGNISRFIFASSGSSIYPTGVSIPLTEDMMTLSLNTPYQITKMLGELYCNYYFKIKNIPIVKARIFNSFGPGEIPGQYRNVIPNFIYWAMSGLTLPITGDGSETRTFTYVGDICNSLLKMGYFENIIGDSINLASGREIEIAYLAELINELTNNQNNIKFIPKRNWDRKSRILASNEKATKLLDFKNTYSFEESIKKTNEWFNENYINIKKSVNFPP